MLNLIFVLDVVGAYSAIVALTRRPRLGWAIVATIALSLTTTLILIHSREGPVTTHNAAAVAIPIEP